MASPEAKTASLCAQAALQRIRSEGPTKSETAGVPEGTGSLELEGANDSFSILADQTSVPEDLDSENGSNYSFSILEDSEDQASKVEDNGGPDLDPISIPEAPKNQVPVQEETVSYEEGKEKEPKPSSAENARGRAYAGYGVAGVGCEVEEGVEMEMTNHGRPVPQIPNLENVPANQNVAAVGEGVALVETKAKFIHLKQAKQSPQTNRQSTPSTERTPEPNPPSEEPSSTTRRQETVPQNVIQELEEITELLEDVTDLLEEYEKLEAPEKENELSVIPVSDVPATNWNSFVTMFSNTALGKLLKGTALVLWRYLGIWITNYIGRKLF